MLTLVLEKQKTKKYLLLNLAYFAFFLGMYFLIDYLNLSYKDMQSDYGTWLVITNIFLNILMAAISATLIGFTSAQFEFSKKESKGATASFLSIIFGIFTYGCTPCLISFFAALGITFSVMALPFAGLPYKLISLLLLILGFIWVLYSIHKTVCKIKSSNNEIK